MHIKIGIDSNYENKAIAWALDYPGCFAYGEDEQEALIGARPRWGVVEPAKTLTPRRLART